MLVTVFSRPTTLWCASSAIWTSQLVMVSVQLCLTCQKKMRLQVQPADFFKTNNVLSSQAITSVTVLFDSRNQVT